MKCTACHCSYRHIPPAPVLFDGTWRRLAHKRENLCWNCFMSRMEERGLPPITLADLRPCPFNHERTGYFDFFKRNASPELIETWLRWLGNATEQDRLWQAEQDRHYQEWKRRTNYQEALI